MIVQKSHIDKSINVLWTDANNCGEIENIVISTGIVTAMIL